MFFGSMFMSKKKKIIYFVYLLALFKCSKEMAIVVFNRRHYYRIMTNFFRRTPYLIFKVFCYNDKQFFLFVKTLNIVFNKPKS